MCACLHTFCILPVAKFVIIYKINNIDLHLYISSYTYIGGPYTKTARVRHHHRHGSGSGNGAPFCA